MTFLYPNKRPIKNIKYNESHRKYNSATSVNPLSNFLWSHCCKIM